jgi:hypothetical protein
MTWVDGSQANASLFSNDQTHPESLSSIPRYTHWSFASTYQPGLRLHKSDRVGFMLQNFIHRLSTELQLSKLLHVQQRTNSSLDGVRPIRVHSVQSILWSLWTWFLPIVTTPPFHSKSLLITPDSRTLRSISVKTPLLELCDLPIRSRLSIVWSISPRCSFEHSSQRQNSQIVYMRSEKFFVANPTLPPLHSLC